MPMNRNVKVKRVCEDWTVTFLQSVLFVQINKKCKSPGKLFQIMSHSENINVFKKKQARSCIKNF